MNINVNVPLKKTVSQGEPSPSKPNYYNFPADSSYNSNNRNDKFQNNPNPNSSPNQSQIPQSPKNQQVDTKNAMQQQYKSELYSVLLISTVEMLKVGK